MMLFWGRALGGVGVGALSTLAPLYISEIAPPAVRGSLMALEQLAIVSGVVAGFWGGYWTRNIQSPIWEGASFRIPLIAQVIPALILLIGSIWLPKSPRGSVLRGLEHDGWAALVQLRLGMVGDIPSLYDHEEEDKALAETREEFLEILVEAQLVRMVERDSLAVSKTGWRAELGLFSLLFSSRYKARTWIGIWMMVFQRERSGFHPRFLLTC